MGRPSSLLNLTQEDVFGVLNAAHQGILLLDADLRAVFINKAFRQIWQLSDEVVDLSPSFEQLLEHGWRMGFYGSQAENMADYVSKRVSQIRNPIGSGQVRVDLSDGRSYVVESVQISKEMKMVTYMDVTVLVSAIKEAETANRAKADFLTSMSHELRTPLNGMMGFAQMLDLGLSGPLNEKQADYVRQIEKGGKHLVDLIDDILSFAKLEIGQLAIQSENVSVVDIMSDARDMIASLADKSGISLIWPEQPASPPSVHVDPLRARQILVNLLSNAIKYNRPAGMVKVGLSEDDAFVKVSVSDEGLGISPDKQPLLFQAFNRLGLEDSDIEGSGIGLALSRKLAETMHGHLDFKSTSGVGSEFWVVFPKAAQAWIVDSAEKDGIGTAVRAGHFTVLYIEDNKPNRTMMEAVLATLPSVGYMVAHNGRDGIAVAREQGPDIILLDLRLPDMTGAEVLKQLRSNNSTAHIPVIALTSSAEVPTEKDREGFEAYLTKPIDLISLLAALDAVLKRWKPKTDGPTPPT